MATRKRRTNKAVIRKYQVQSLYYKYGKALDKIKRASDKKEKTAYTVHNREDKKIMREKDKAVKEAYSRYRKGMLKLYKRKK